MLKLLNTGIASAETNMRLDESLLEELDPKGEPILHFYDWQQPSLTYGYFIRPEQHLDLEQAQKRGLQLARRPTGGGIVFHIWDFAFSFLLPSSHPSFSLNTLENYQFVNSGVLEVMKEFFSLKDSVELIAQNMASLGPNCQYFCMAKPTQYDVVYKGMKIAGAAQRKRKQGYLHQGTISLALPQIDLLQEVLLSQAEILEAMQAHAFAPLGSSFHRLQEARREIQQKLAEQFCKKLS